jgi:hypothetical protein
VPSFNSLEEIPDSLRGSVTLTVIATSTAAILTALRAAIVTLPNSDFLIEKPVSLSRLEISKLEYWAKTLNREIHVNLPRTSFAENSPLRQVFSELSAKDQILLNVKVSGGILHTGVHALHHLRLLSGEPLELGGRDLSTGLIQLISNASEHEAKNWGFLEITDSLNSEFEWELFVNKMHRVSYHDSGDSITVFSENEGHKLVSSRPNYQLVFYKWYLGLDEQSQFKKSCLTLESVAPVLSQLAKHD